MHKIYFTGIAFVQELLVWAGIATLIILPIILSYALELIPGEGIGFLFTASLISVFFVMLIRPLADLFPSVAFLRPLVILRKGFGVLSASIIVSFMLSRFLLDGFGYITEFFTPERWSLLTGAFLSPLGDVSALILLITSNRFSKRILGKNWKRIQKLAYVYFYAGCLYEYIFLDQTIALWFMVIVTAAAFGAYVKKRLTPP